MNHHFEAIKTQFHIFYSTDFRNDGKGGGGHHEYA